MPTVQSFNRKPSVYSFKNILYDMIYMSGGFLYSIKHEIDIKTKYETKIQKEWPVLRPGLNCHIVGGTNTCTGSLNWLLKHLKMITHYFFMI